MNAKIGLLVGASFLLVCLALAAIGKQPLAFLWAVVQGSLGRPAGITGMLRETTPLLIAGLAVFVAFRAGLFNIGVDGQFVIGACACTAVAIAMPGLVGILLGIVAGMAGGMVWAYPAGWIKAYRNGHEVITTIMLNNVAILFTSALVIGPMRDPSIASPSTSLLTASTRIASFPVGPVMVNWGLLVGIVLTAVLWQWLRRSLAGYELQATGANPDAAAVAGIHTKAVTVTAMVASGALAGLAGAIYLLAFQGRFYPDFSPGYGFDALGIALLAGGQAWGVIPAALAFGILTNSGTTLAIEGVPRGITTIVLGSLILTAAAIRYRRFVVRD